MGFFEQVSLVSLVVILCILVAHTTRRAGLISLALFLVAGFALGAFDVVSPTLMRGPRGASALAAAAALMLFMGGFSTSLSTAGSFHVRGCALGVVGTALSCALAAPVAHFMLGLDGASSVVLGAALACTDVGALFTLIRGRGLILRRGPASVLQMEAGLSVPVCLLIIAAAQALAAPDATVLSACAHALASFGISLACGGAVAVASLACARLLTRAGQAISAVFVCAVALLAIALPGLFASQGFLSAWLCGLALGNAHMAGKAQIAHFFDGLRVVLHIGMLLSLGIACAHDDILACAPAGIAIFAVLMLVARPLAVLATTSYATVARKRQLFLCLAGIRGAMPLALMLSLASSLWGMQLMASADVLGVAFWVSLLSLALQSPLALLASRQLDVRATAHDSAVRSFTDYEGAAERALIELTVHENRWDGKAISELDLPSEALVVLIRRGSDEIIPQGSTRLIANDRVIVSMPAYAHRLQDSVTLREEYVGPAHPWAGRSLAHVRLPQGSLAVAVKRGPDTLTPDGSTILQAGDTLVLSHIERTSAELLKAVKLSNTPDAQTE